MFNKEAYIERAICSVFAQQVDNFEIIVVDDGSTDDGAAKVVNFRDERIVLIQQNNLGVSAARNRGIKAASGELIAFLDADDEWLPGFLNEILILRNEYPDAGIYGTAYEFKNANGSRTKASLTGIPSNFRRGEIDNYFEILKKGGEPIWTSAVAVPASTLSQVGLFPIGVPRGEDVYLWGKIALNHPIAYSRFTGSIYHRDASNRACKKNLDREGPLSQWIREQLRNNSFPLGIRDDLEAYLQRRDLHVGINYILQGDIIKGRRLLGNVKGGKLKWKQRFWRVMSLLPQKLVRFLFETRKKTMRRLECMLNS